MPDSARQKTPVRGISAHVGSLGDRLLLIREREGLTKQALADISGRSDYKSWTRYEAGKNIPSATVIANLTALGYDANWLLTGEGSMLRQAPMDEASAGGPIDLDDGGFGKLTLYDARASAGVGAGESDDIGERQLAFRKDFLARKGVTEKTAYLITIAGDSMYPLLRDGGVAMIDTKQTDIRTKPGIYAIRARDELFVKRVTYTTDGVVLISENTNYPALVIKPDDLLPGAVLGRVVWGCGDLD